MCEGRREGGREAQAKCPRSTREAESRLVRGKQQASTQGGQREGQTRIPDGEQCHVLWEQSRRGTASMLPYPVSSAIAKMPSAFSYRTRGCGVGVGWHSKHSVRQNGGNMRDVMWIRAVSGGEEWMLWLLECGVDRGSGS